MNLPVAHGRPNLAWTVFRLVTRPSTFYRDDQGRLRKTKPYREDALDWCVDNIQGPWAESLPEGGDVHVFKFQDKRDAMLFKLAWSLDLKR